MASIWLSSPSGGQADKPRKFEDWSLRAGPDYAMMPRQPYTHNLTDEEHIAPRRVGSLARVADAVLEHDKRISIVTFQVFRSIDRVDRLCDAVVNVPPDSSDLPGRNIRNDVAMHRSGRTVSVFRFGDAVFEAPKLI